MRLIDADKFLEDNAAIVDYDIDHPKFQETMRELIESAPTIELLKEQSRKQILSFGDGYAEGYKAKDQEIVRCKDCKWWHDFHCENDNVTRKIQDCGCYPNFNTEGDWFCADGERRTDDA